MKPAYSEPSAYGVMDSRVVWVFYQLEESWASVAANANLQEEDNKLVSSQLTWMLVQVKSNNVEVGERSGGAFSYGLRKMCDKSVFDA